MENDELSRILNLTDEILRSEIKFKLKQIAGLRVKENLTPAEINTLEKLTRDIEQEKNRLLGITEPPVEFSDPMQVTLYLQEQGWKVKKSTVYNHAKQNIPGRNIKKLSPDASGKYPLSAVEKYARENLQKYNISDQENIPNPEQTLLEMIQSEHIQTTNRLKKAQAENWEKRNRDLDKEVKRIIGQELAVRARFFRLNLTNFFHAHVIEIISISGGDQIKAPELIEFCISSIETFLAPFSEERQFQLPATQTDSLNNETTDEDIPDEPFEENEA